MPGPSDAATAAQTADDLTDDVPARSNGVAPPEATTYDPAAFA
jgi:hypothetical protein